MHNKTLRDFIFREAGPEEENRLALIRYLAPSVFIAGGMTSTNCGDSLELTPGRNMFLPTGLKYQSPTLCCASLSDRTSRKETRRLPMSMYRVWPFTCVSFY